MRRIEGRPIAHESHHKNRQEKIEANHQKMDNINETVEAAVKSVWSKLEETLTRWVDDILLRFDQLTRPLRGT
jgi:uncharacterized membrane-anchored protein YjiN (DUF445 family)